MAGGCGREMALPEGDVAGDGLLATGWRDSLHNGSILLLLLGFIVLGESRKTTLRFRDGGELRGCWDGRNACLVGVQEILGNTSTIGAVEAKLEALKNKRKRNF